MKKHYLLLVVWLLTSCGKNFLEKKSNDSLVILSSLEDCESLLNDTHRLNLFSSYLLAFVGADEYYLTDQVYNAMPTEYEKRAYNWMDDVYGTDRNIHDWDRGYQKILLANLVIDKLRSITPKVDEDDRWHQALGEALFIRAINYYQLAQLFCPTYIPSTSKTEVGIPIRLEADITLSSNRATVFEVYQSIINDLIEAESLLGIRIENLYTPSRLSAWALLAKVYLHTEDYEKSKFYAEEILKIKSELIDFNTINVDHANFYYVEPIYEKDNKEIIYSLTPNVSKVGSSVRQNVDTLLLSLYAENDLRKRAFYTKAAGGNIVFKGSYLGEGRGTYFSGLSLNEVYLIAAESNARLAQLDKSLHWINILLANRHQSYKPLAALGKDELLKRILVERRKELPFRGIRWEDLRRLNKESAFEETIQRRVNNVVFTLEPNAKKYVWPIPKLEMSLGNY